MKKEVRLTMSHVDDGILHAYLDGELSPVEVERLEAHVTGCPVCRARLDEERALIERASRLLGMAVPPGPEREAPPLHQLRQPRVIGKRLVIPLAWAATIVLALGLGYYAASTSYRPGPQETVARQTPQESVASPLAVAVAPQSAATVSDRSAERSLGQRQEPAAPRPRPSAPAVGVESALADRAAREESDEAGRQNKAAAQLPAAQADVRLRGAVASAPASANTIIIDSSPQRYAETRGAAVPLSTNWPVIQPQPAHDLLGGAPAMIPGYPVRALRRNPMAAREIVVEQELSPGVVVSLYEQPLDLGPGPASLSRLDAQAPRDSLAAKARTNERLARFVGRLRIEIAGPLPKDSLNRLLESVKP
jgi:putative zinc finger protein